MMHSRLRLNLKVGHVHMHNTRLNSYAHERGMGPLSDADKEELATWFASMATNTDPDKVLPVPDCYKPVAAWLQMHGHNMVNEGDTDVKPWSMPQALIEYWADVWYANRVGMLRAFQLQKDAQGESSDALSGVLMGIHNDPKKSIGRA
jgi:hypothetical protein